MREGYAVAGKIRKFSLLVKKHLDFWAFLAYVDAESLGVVQAADDVHALRITRLSQKFGEVCSGMVDASEQLACYSEYVVAGFRRS